MITNLIRDLKAMFKTITIFLIVGNIHTTLNATGPSNATITLTPIASNEASSTVLFQTYRNISSNGGYSDNNMAYGWLVVSAVYNIWDERVAIKGDDNDPKSREKLKAYEKRKVNLDHPDKVLKKIMEEYYFDKDSKLLSEKYSVLELKPKQSCYKGKCINRVLTQKTIENHISSNIINSIRGYTFSFKGIVLLHNTREYKNDDGGEEVVYGGEFSNFQNLWGEHDIGYELMNIDALALFDPYVFTEPSRAKKVEVQKVVKDIFSLLKNKRYKEFNQTYIHPKYGFGELYAMAASGFYYSHDTIRDINKNRRTFEDTVYLDNFVFVPNKINWGVVEFDDENWSRDGVYISDKTYYDNIINAYWDKIDLEYWSKKDIENAKFFSEDVMVVTDTQHDIIFHIKKIGGRWYVVLFDRIYTNRDA